MVLYKGTAAGASWPRASWRLAPTSMVRSGATRNTSAGPSAPNPCATTSKTADASASRPSPSQARRYAMGRAVGAWAWVVVSFMLAPGVLWPGRTASGRGLLGPALEGLVHLLEARQGAPVQGPGHERHQQPAVVLLLDQANLALAERLDGEAVLTVEEPG